MMSTGDGILDTFSMLEDTEAVHQCNQPLTKHNSGTRRERGTYFGKASKQYVFLVSGKATLMPEVRGEWRTTAAHSNRDARSTVGTVPMLCPYRMMFSGLMPYLET